MLYAEQFASTGKAGLNLISNQQDAMLRASFAEAFQKLLRTHAETAFTLDRLNDDRSHTGRINVRSKHQIKRIEAIRNRHTLRRERHMKDVTRHGAELCLVRIHLAGHGRRKQRAPMEATGKRDNA